jgi:hypothetical protein
MTIQLALTIAVMCVAVAIIAWEATAARILAAVGLVFAIIALVKIID